MELFFNEISISPLSNDKYEAAARMKTFAEATAVARTKGFRNVRSPLPAAMIPLSPDYTLSDWLNKDAPETYRDLIYSMFVIPFMREGNEEIETRYIEADYYFEDAPSGIARTECTGLAAAYLNEMPSVSFTSLPVWHKTKLEIIVEAAGATRREWVFNIATKESFDNGEIDAFIESLGELDLPETTIAPDDKKVHISSHHGEKELNDFWKKLKRSPYVIEMRSNDWGGKRFIRKVEKTGVVEIVLVDTDRQYAMWVQTTGRNLRETKAIAGILEAEFS